jgi:prepilin-type N-terminal cleavage/methylation domain-containing protein
MPKRTNNKGFTLVELMVTLAVLAIMAGVAIPSVLAWMPAIHLKDTALDVKGAMIRARSMAINEGVEARLVLVSANDTYRIEKGNLTSGSTVWATAYGPLPMANGVSVSATTAGIEMSGADPVLTFGVDGSVETNLDSLDVTLQNSEGHTYLVSVVRRTGHPTTTKGP